MCMCTYIPVVAFSNDGEYLATGDWAGRIVVFREGEEVCVLLLRKCARHVSDITWVDGQVSPAVHQLLILARCARLG